MGCGPQGVDRPGDSHPALGPDPRDHAADVGIDLAHNVAAFWIGAIAILWLLGLWLRDAERITVFGDVDRFFSDLTLTYPRNLDLAISLVIEVLYMPMSVWGASKASGDSPTTHRAPVSGQGETGLRSMGPRWSVQAIPIFFEALLCLTGDLVIYDASESRAFAASPTFPFSRWRGGGSAPSLRQRRPPRHSQRTVERRRGRRKEPGRTTLHLIERDVRTVLGMPDDLPGPSQVGHPCKQSFRIRLMRCRRHILFIGATLLCILAVSGGGCHKPLFPEHEPRTQYERYQLLRGQYRPVSQPSPYGVQQPALRERLAPLEERY